MNENIFLYLLQYEVYLLSCGECETRGGSRRGGGEGLSPLTAPGQPQTSTGTPVETAGRDFISN